MTKPFCAPKVIIRVLCNGSKYCCSSLGKVLLATLISSLVSSPQPIMLAQPLCASNIRYPRVPADYMCGEWLIDYAYMPGLASISALTFGPDGSLYFARPLKSQIIRLQPDRDGFLKAPYTDPRIFADHLPEPPNGLTYYDGAWYVSADTTITRLRDTNQDGVADEQQVIVKGLPGGSGGWLGNIHVGPDKRLYVAKTASCDACAEVDSRRAALLSFALDGSDPQIVARGLRDSYDFDWQPGTGALYIVDNERATFPAELNVIQQPGALPGPNFGWPNCDPDGNPVSTIPDARQQNCANTLKPTLQFASGSHPTGLAFYHGNAFPAIQGRLLVAFGGSWNGQDVAGYALHMVNFNAAQSPVSSQVLLPDAPAETVADAAFKSLSFYPEHPIGLAISPEGWIYISVLEGRIYRFRPRA